MVLGAARRLGRIAGLGGRKKRGDGGMGWLLVGLLSPQVTIIAVALLLLALAFLGTAGVNANTDAAAAASSTGSCGSNPSAATGPVTIGSGAPASSAASSGPPGSAQQAAAISSAAAAATGSPLPPSVAQKVQAAAGYKLVASQVQSAQLIVAVAKGMKLDERAMRIALAVSYDAAGLLPSPPIHGGEIAGLFGQWVTDNPGVNLTDPLQSVTAFYANLRGLAAYNNPAASIGEVAAAATAPHGKAAAIYQPRDTWAAAVVALLDTGDTSAITDTGSSGTGIDCITGAVTGPVPGLTPAQAKNAAAIVTVGSTRRLPKVAVEIAVAVAIAESELLNYANDGTSTDRGYFDDGHRPLNPTERAVAALSMGLPHDAVGHNLDSCGLFQQRPSAGWGTPAELMNPATSAGKFFDALAKVAGWQGMAPWTAAQTVQGSNSSDGGIYKAAYQQATGIVAALSAAPAAPASGAPGGAGGGAGGVVLVNGPTITLPAKTGVAGSITAPNPTVAKAISAGLSWVGEPYSWGGGNPAGPTLGICGPNGAENDCHLVGFDCSGLMQYQWAQVGVSISHFSQDQWSAGQQVPFSSALPGDMLGYPGHITMYLGKINGADYMLEAPQSGEFVHVTPVRGGFYSTASRVWVTAR